MLKTKLVHSSQYVTEPAPSKSPSEIPEEDGAKSGILARNINDEQT